MSKGRLLALMGLAAVSMLLLFGYRGWQADGAATAVAPTERPKAQAALKAASAPAAAVAVAAPFSVEGQRAREHQLAQARERLARARHTLDSYRESTRYPYESRPIGQHPDQVHPFDPIVEERPLRVRGGEVATGVRLRTTQDRVFASGAESVRFTVSAQGDDGRVLPLLVTRAVAFDLPDPRQAIGRPQVPVVFADAGRDGDARAGDGVFSARLQPAQQGFADYAGTIRVSLDLNQEGRLGTVFFDLVYEPQVPAVWAGGVREAMVEGSLGFYLRANVVVPGRYVVSARIDDADGKPFALLGFNDEIAAGTQEISLKLFGKLVRDAAPRFPLRLRDVQGFLLFPNRFPDRAMMPRLAGVVHTSGMHALASFSDAEWTSEERTRYLAELTRDVEDATDELDRLRSKK